MSGQNLKKMMETMKKMTRLVKPPGPPKVWEVVEKKGKDGRPIKFTIQEIPKDRNEEAVDHMCKHFLEGEPTCALFNAVNTPIFVDECRVLWNHIVDQGIAVAAFTDDPKGGKPVMAGVNMLCMEYKDTDKTNKEIEFQSMFRVTYEVLKKFNTELRIYDRYGIDKYLYAVGLSVTPAFRGYGLGTDILKVRDKVGREYKIPVTITTFTSPFSIKSAEKAGFEHLLKKNFCDVVDENGKEYFPGIQKFSETVIVMGKRLY